jgi:uncharacterized membrane protein
MLARLVRCQTEEVKACRRSAGLDVLSPAQGRACTFSFVIGMIAQVSDVGITDRIIRRTATVHGIISFVSDTALVALMVNIAASAISS